MNQFWMVWNPQGHSPTVKHESEESAAREAERLARSNRGQSFYVLEAVQLRIVDDMRRVNLRGGFDGSDIPF